LKNLKVSKKQPHEMLKWAKWYLVWHLSNNSKAKG